MTESDRERFNSKILEVESGCHEWQGATGDGYGMFRLNGKTKTAHKLSYQIHKGDIPNGLIIRHTCNNRRCVNPEHLILGTHKENHEDAVKAGTRDAFKHPSRNAYNYGCRCKKCIELTRLASQRFRDRHKSKKS